MRKKNSLLALLMTFVMIFTSVSFVASAESIQVAAPTRVTEVEAMRKKNSETYIIRR